MTEAGNAHAESRMNLRLFLPALEIDGTLLAQARVELQKIVTFLNALIQLHRHVFHRAHRQLSVLVPVKHYVLVLQ